MAKRKKPTSQPWDAVFDRVQMEYYADRKYPPKTTATELDAMEAQLSFQFPLSYRAFAERFGLGGWLRGGSESELYLLTSPEPSEPAFRRASVLDDTLSIRAHPDWFDHYQLEYPNMAFEQLIAFGGGGNGGDNGFMFYPPEVTDKRNRECRIYWSSSSSGLEASADSFAEWLDMADQSFTRWDEEVATPQYPVVLKPNRPIPDAIPYCLTNEIGTKITPTTTDARLWLAWNNNTVRDLALSIRDRGQTDAFPILADALQEAGCTNADLLDSCRTGDPDIDGKWVLQVLLGGS